MVAIRTKNFGLTQYKHISHSCKHITGALVRGSPGSSGLPAPAIFWEHCLWGSLGSFSGPLHSTGQWVKVWRTHRMRLCQAWSLLVHLAFLPIFHWQNTVTWPQLYAREAWKCSSSVPMKRYWDWGHLAVHTCSRLDVQVLAPWTLLPTLPLGFPTHVLSEPTPRTGTELRLQTETPTCSFSYRMFD